MSRSLLENAAELLNKIWLAYREEICADQTDQIVWKSPRRLILRSGCLEKTIKKRPGTTSPLMKFPEKLCKLPHDKVILLNFLQCNVAVTHMQCILEWLLKGKHYIWTCMQEAPNGDGRCCVQDRSRIVSAERPSPHCYHGT